MNEIEKRAFDLLAGVVTNTGYVREIFALEAVITALTPQWQPIDTAPRDGTWVLLTGGWIDSGWCDDEFPEVVSGQYLRSFREKDSKLDEWQFAWYDSGYYGIYTAPTHWLPMPTLPEAA